VLQIVTIILTTSEYLDSKLQQVCLILG